MMIHTCVEDRIVNSNWECSCDIGILYDQQQIYLYLLLQDHNTSNNYQNI